MNKTIRALKDQALNWAMDTLDPEALSVRQWAAAIDEKFAELIVRECAEICLEANDHKNILRHFGVEK